jgi:hypothetical protein
MKWYEERTMNQAPVQYDNEQAHAWAAGYNAAIDAYLEFRRQEDLNRIESY